MNPLAHGHPINRLACLFGVLALTAGCQSSAPIDITKVLTWLPSDTETLIVANGPFWMSNFRVDESRVLSRTISTEELQKYFRRLILSEVLRFATLSNTLDRERVVIAVEGSRRFRRPTGLGLMPYEGCEIVVFARDQTGRFESFMQEAVTRGLKVDEIEGNRVAVAREMREEDIWTTFVAHPSERVIVAATNRDYLQEALARIRGDRGQRALPDSLPEWKHIDRDAEFWGLRHYKEGASEEDLTSPLRCSREWCDKQAIGLIFGSSPSQQRIATITYFSRDPERRRSFDRFFLESEEGYKGLQMRSRDITPDGAENSFVLRDPDSVHHFFFGFLFLVGHGLAL
ncbi:MAG TPA: hypothetical protein VE398_08920 [Acidobacteriota bacterium]|nr:hypothetical protein [Acidobacteriota bacterium]